MNNVILLNNQQEVINEEPWTYKQFKDWVDNQVDFAEAMSLPANKKVLDVMMEKMQRLGRKLQICLKTAS